MLMRKALLAATVALVASSPLRTFAASGELVIYTSQPNKDAQQTEAHQVNRSLLLSESSLADTRPQLEIYADDVRCTHGATIGRLDDDVVFYLRSRGLPEREARTLLTRAFASEILDDISPPALRDELTALVAGRVEDLAAEGAQS